jgi:vitamin B12 transporter
LERDGFSRARPLITKENYYAKGGYKETDKILQFSDHLIFDYSAFYNLTPKARIGISVSNLFDENYTEKDGYNMPGRNIMGHASYFF